MGFTPGGGGSFGTPDFSDAVPPDPIRQGDPAPEGMGQNRVDEHTFEDGLTPQARAPMESDWEGLVNNKGGLGDNGPVRGYRPEPVGGTYNPGQGTSGRSSKGAETSGPTERSNASA